MNIINGQFARNFLVQPLLKNILQGRFNIGDLVQGKVIQALAKNQLFVLHVKGMNLIAQTRIAMFVGDRFVGKVMNNKEQIELKLYEVNGKPVHHQISIAEEQIAYARVPLPESFWGKETFLEIYPDKESQSQGENSKCESCHFILTSEALQNIVVDLVRKNSLLHIVTRIENPGLFHFMTLRSAEIEQTLRDETFKKVIFQALLLTTDLSFFRKQWSSEMNLDIRA